MRSGGTWPVRVLVACVAVLLPAGAWSAATIDPRASRTVGAAGFVQEGVVEESPAPAIDRAVASTIVAPPPVPAMAPAPAPAPTAPPPRVTTTTTAQARPAATTTTVATLLPGLPPIPILQPPVNSWSNSTNGVTAHLRMEPASPLPGQPVRFLLDVVAPGACCAMNLSYGDGVVSPNPGGGCDSPTTRTATLTHTFTSPGDYELFLVVITFPCDPKMVDGAFVPPPLYATSIKTCITVGLRLIGQPACAPFNHFGPGTVYSSA